MIWRSSVDSVPEPCDRADVRRSYDAVVALSAQGTIGRVGPQPLERVVLARLVRGTRARRDRRSRATPTTRRAVPRPRAASRRSARRSACSISSTMRAHQPRVRRARDHEALDDAHDLGDVEDEDVVALLVVGGAGRDPGPGADVGSAASGQCPGVGGVGHTLPCCGVIRLPVCHGMPGVRRRWVNSRWHARSSGSEPERSGRVPSCDGSRALPATTPAATASTTTADLRPCGRGAGRSVDRRCPVEPSGLTVEVVGAQDARGRGRNEEVDRLAGRDPAAQVGRRQLEARHRDARDAPTGGRGKRRRSRGRRSRASRSSRSSSTRCHVGEARRDVAADHEERARGPVRRAARRCRSCTSARRGRARCATPRGRRRRRARPRASRSEPRPARSRGRASATDRGRRPPAPGRGRAGGAPRTRPSDGRRAPGRRFRPGSRSARAAVGTGRVLRRTLCERRVAGRARLGLRVVAFRRDHDPRLTGERRRRSPRRAGVASRPTRCARSRRVAHRRDRRRHRRRRRARTQRARRGRRVRRRAREHGSREAARARDRRGRRRVGRAVGTRRSLPRRAARRARNRRAGVRGRRRRPRCGAGSSIACASSSAPTGPSCCAATSCVAAVGDDVPDASVLDALATGTGASPAVAAGDSGPEDLAVAPLAGERRGAARRPRRSSVPAARASSTARARAHRRPRRVDARLARGRSS